MRDVDATITFKKGPRLRNAYVLDGHGHRRKTLRVERTDAGVVVKPAPDALYTIVR